MNKDDPSQNKLIVNGMFAAQNLPNLTIDCLVLQETWADCVKKEKEEELKAAKKGRKPPAASQAVQSPYIMIQAAQQTGGIFRELNGKWCAQGSTSLIFELINNFLPSNFPCR